MLAMTADDIAILERLAEEHPDPADYSRASPPHSIELGVPMPPVTLCELERSLEEKHEGVAEVFLHLPRT